MQHTKHLRLEENRRRWSLNLKAYRVLKNCSYSWCNDWHFFGVLSHCVTAKSFKLLFLPDNRVCVVLVGVCCVLFFVLFCFFFPPPKRPPCQNSRCVDEKKSHWKDWWDWIFVFLFCTALKEIYKEQSATKHKKSIYLGNGVAKWVTQMVWELESSQAGFSREKLRVARAGCDLTVPSSFSFPPQVYSSVYFCGHLFFLVAYLIMPYLRKALVPKNEGREKKQE